MPKTRKGEKKEMKFSKDEFGKEVLLRGDSLQVMMAWEKPYMELSIETLQPSGEVLEIGFGMGYSSDQIQKHHPKNHIIIESEPIVVKRAKEWAKQHPNTTIIEGRWQDILPTLGAFDAIFFDAYTPSSPDEIEELAENTAKCEEVVQEARMLKDALAVVLKQCQSLKFSDENLLDFTKKVWAKPGVTLDSVLDFLNTLKKQGNITADQHSRFVKEAKKQEKDTNKETYAEEVELEWVGTAETASNVGDAQTDRFITFAEQCIEKHLHPKGKLCAYVRSPGVKKQFLDFAKEMLARKDIRYKEKFIPVEVPKNCTYYQEKQALVIVIEKK